VALVQYISRYNYLFEIKMNRSLSLSGNKMGDRTAVISGKVKTIGKLNYLSSV
jgi:hypothetical protein